MTTDQQSIAAGQVWRRNSDGVEVEVIGISPSLVHFRFMNNWSLAGIDNHQPADNFRSRFTFVRDGSAV